MKHYFGGEAGIISLPEAIRMKKLSDYLSIDKLVYVNKTTLKH
jgi:hypothetical protein